MNKRPLVLIALLAGAPAHAFEAVATVVSVVPSNETVSRPSQRCWTEYQQGDAYTRSVPVQRCEQVGTSETRTSYTVTYEYAGQRFATRLPYDPGSQLRVNVSVTPK